MRLEDQTDEKNESLKMSLKFLYELIYGVVCNSNFLERVAKRRMPPIDKHLTIAFLWFLKEILTQRNPPSPVCTTMATKSPRKSSQADLIISSTTSWSSLRRFCWQHFRQNVLCLNFRRILLLTAFRGWRHPPAHQWSIVELTLRKLETE